MFSGHMLALDGCSSKHFAMLSPSALAAVALLLELVLAALPLDELADCFARMIPKPDSPDRRPIFLFRTLDRIAARIVSWQAKAWAAAHSCVAIVSSATRQASDAVYRTQVRRIFCDSAFIELLLDIKRRFDQLDREQLRRLAEAAGYPPLALALTQRLNELKR